MQESNHVQRNKEKANQITYVQIFQFQYPWFLMFQGGI
jgi:hypothetical protein